MTALFTPDERQEIYDHLLKQFMDDTRITGVLSMGAEDETFVDDAAGIDLLVIIEKPSIIDIVFTLWVKRLEDIFDANSSFSTLIDEDLHIVSILLDNYLQVSVQFRSVNRFHLVGNDWCVAFDRNNLIRDYLDKRMMTREHHIRTMYEQHMRTIWNPVVSCVREINRNNLWKAAAELETLRKHMVEVAGLRHLEFTQDYRNMGLLPEMFQVQLRHTLPTSVTSVAIRRALITTLGMLFTETTVLDAQFDTSYTDDLQNRLTSFVELYA